MIVFLLLVIIAILLFGSSRVLGCIGMAAGGVVALFAAGWAIQLWEGLDTTGRVMLVASPFIAIGAVLLAAWLYDLQRERNNPTPKVKVKSVKERMEELLEEAERQRTGGK